MNKTKSLLFMSAIAVVTVSTASAQSVSDGGAVNAHLGKPENRMMRATTTQGVPPRVMAEKHASSTAGLGMQGILNEKGNAGVLGTITAINGTTFTVIRRNGPPQATTTATFTVNASGAVVFKGKATSTVAGLSIGDTVLIHGTIATSTRTITAKQIVQTGQKTATTTQEDFSNDRGEGRGNGRPFMASTTASSTRPMNQNRSTVFSKLRSMLPSFFR
ncbi:MAG: hypothetical protein RLZZ308_692 [Candidatus Parcubacteria bacterium]|jgi:hypothetical protein